MWDRINERISFGYLAIAKMEWMMNFLVVIKMTTTDRIDLFDKSYP